MNRVFRLFLPGLLCLCKVALGASPIAWEKWPAIPDEHGFAGPFAGVSSGTLVVAGGANFPDSYPWEEGSKVWHDRIFLLPEGAKEWTVSKLKLPKALAYGVSVSLPERNSIVMLGGSDSGNIPTTDVLELKVLDEKVSMRKLPSLPVALAESSGLTVGNTIYVFSGKSAGGTVRKAFRLDFESEPLGWEELSWPEGARGRMHSVAGLHDGKIFLFGGRDQQSDSELEHPEDRLEAKKLDFLRDCYRFDPDTGKWTRIADLPQGSSAAPYLAIPSGSSHLLMLGGVTAPYDEEQLAARPEINGQGHEHPGFSRTVLAYHVITDTWVEAGTLPPEMEVPVTVPVVLMPTGEYVIPSGEKQPGVRTTQVFAGKIARSSSSFGLINWLVVGFYLLLMVGIGYFFMKRESASSTEAYFRGSKRIPWWVAGLSIFATMLSAITFMAIPAKAYVDNMNAWIGMWPMVIIIPLVVFYYLPFFRKLNVTSAYEFLEQRFNLASRLIASALFMLFHVGRVAIVLYLPALALSSVTDINIFIAILSIGILCIAYTVMGGLEAVVWTDAIQAIVLLGGALLCIIVIVFQMDGGLGAIIEVAQTDSKLLTVDWGTLDFGASTNSAWVIMAGFMFASLPSYTAGQDVVQRYVSTPTEKEAARSLWLNMPMTILGSLLFFGLGVALYAFYQTQPALLDPAMERNDGILPFFILQNLPVGVAGLIVAGIFAAAQSTISSSLNSVATAYVTDFHGRVLKPESSDKERLQVAKSVVLILGVIGISVAALIAYTSMKSAFDSYNTFIGMALGPVGGIFFLGVFTKRPCGHSGLIGALIGFLTVLVIHFARSSGSLDLWPVLNGLISFCVTVLVGWSVGVFVKQPS
jgi:SSS family solute:Na+ symporter